MLRQWLRERGAWWHAQNLNEKPGGALGSMLRHGRAWLHVANCVLSAEWSHGKPGLALQAKLDRDEGTVSVNVAVPGGSWWLSFEGIPRAWMERLPFRANRTRYNYQGSNRSVGFTWHDGALWISLWRDDMEWRHDDPWWWSLHVNFADLLFGKTVYSDRVFQEVDVQVPMPERSYPATVKMSVSEWRRPRWPWRPFSKTRTSAQVDVPGGIGMPGKGENSWDCGDDATYGMSCEASTPEQAIGLLVARVLRDRMRRGGAHTFTPSGPAHPPAGEEGAPCPSA